VAEQVSERLERTARDYRRVGTKPHWRRSVNGSSPRRRSRGFSGTVAEATDLPGRDQDAVVRLFTFRNDTEMIELVASDIMPHLV
jgi:hypothetical protein